MMGRKEKVVPFRYGHCWGIYVKFLGGSLDFTHLRLVFPHPRVANKATSQSHHPSSQTPKYVKRLVSSVNVKRQSQNFGGTFHGFLRTGFVWFRKLGLNGLSSTCKWGILGL